MVWIRNTPSVYVGYDKSVTCFIYTCELRDDKAGNFIELHVRV